MGDRHGEKAGNGFQRQKAFNQANTPAGRALAEAKRQREGLKTGVKIAATLAPSPIGAGMTLGNMMGEASEKVLAANPDKVKTIPGVPGGVYGNVGGMTYSNRADYPGSPSEKSAKRTGRKDRLGAAAMTLYG
jgi:hypothetical protein